MNDIILKDMEYMYSYDSSLWDALRNKTVLVTGAYGMLPSYMVFMLIYLNEIADSHNIEIVTLVRNEDKLKKRFGKYVDRDYFHVLKGDVTEPIDYSGKIDYIIHGASPASSQYYNTNPVGVLMPNILGTYNTLEAARKNNVSGYLFFSSGEVYGGLEKEVIHEEDCGAMDPADVRSCYGEGKRAGETMCRCWQHQYGTPTHMVRPCHTYGPTMDLEHDSRVFSEFVSNVVNGQDIKIKSDGLAVRIFCYIADATLGYFYVLLRGNPGEPYNVANREGRCTIRELAQTISGLYPEKNIKVSYAEHDKNYMENQHKVHSLYSTEKLEKLGWKPSFSIKEGFGRTIDSFMKK